MALPFVLERIPAEPAAWKRHPKSMRLGELGRHWFTPPTGWPGMLAEAFERRPG
jgi:hypothetical protein